LRNRTSAAIFLSPDPSEHPTMYAIAFGQRLFGKCDKVPGKYHVATLCWHFCYLPLLPLGTHLILDERMDGMSTTFRGVRIPFSFKSYLLAWSRTLLTFPFFMSLVILLMSILDKDPRMARALPYAIAIAATLTLLLFGPYFIPGLGRATASRAAALAAYAPPPPPKGKIAVYQ
jgi:hypothetical protein